MSKNYLHILLIVIVAGGTCIAKPEYGLIGAWDFENGYTDVSGVEPLYTGTALGAAAIINDPMRGNVLNFPGPAGRVSFGPSTGGKLDISDVVSVACWVKIAPNLTGSWLPVWGKGPGGYRAFLHADAPGFTCLMQYGLAGGLSWPWVPIDPDNKYDIWMHLGFTYDGDYVRGYLNGEMTQELQVEGFDTLEGWKRDLWSGSACPYVFSLGGLVGFQNYFKGQIDDVAVWRGVLDTQDFYDLYSAAKTIHQIVPKPPFGQFAWDQSLIAAYTFEGDTADVSPGPAQNGVLDNGAEIVSDTEMGNVLYGPSDPNNFYVDCGSAAKFDNVAMGTDPNEGFTMTAWIKPDADNPEAWAMIAAKGGAGYRMYYHSIDPSTGGRTLGGTVNAGDTPSEESYGNGGSMQPGQWYHVAIVYNPNYPPGYDPADPNTWGDPDSFYPNDPAHGPGRLRGYIDGLAAFGHPSDDLSPNHFRGPLWDTSADPLTIKTSSGGFVGKIDDVRVYNRPLNQLEIRWVMEQKCDPAMVGSDYTDDCSVTIDDVNVMADEWLNRYDLKNFARMGLLWLEMDMFLM